MSRALLIFARRPYPGRVKTRLVPLLSPEEAASLYECMLRDVLTRTRELAGVTRFLFYEDDPEAAGYFRELDEGLLLQQQVGFDLGQRLTDAFARVFAGRFFVAAVIGTDSPDLPLSYIEQAFAGLEAGRVDVVFGPVEDGGYYLAALKKPCPELFREIPWSTGAVLETSRNRAAAAGLSPLFLPRWHDIDTPSDLARPELHDEVSGAPLTRQFLGRIAPRWYVRQPVTDENPGNAATPASL